jgi:hypothetical protein
LLLLLLLLPRLSLSAVDDVAGIVVVLIFRHVLPDVSIAYDGRLPRFEATSFIGPLLRELIAGFGSAKQNRGGKSGDRTSVEC